jgi:hypothetical protein
LPVLPAQIPIDGSLQLDLGERARQVAKRRRSIAGNQRAQLRPIAVKREDRADEEERFARLGKSCG